VGWVGRILGFGVGLALLAAGAVGLALGYAPDAPWLAALDPVLSAVGQAAGTTGRAFDAGQARAFLSDGVIRLALSFIGLLLVGSALRRPAQEAKTVEKPVGEQDAPLARGVRRHFEKEARALAKKGQLAQAAEVYRDAGELDQAVTILEEEGAFERAAEIRREQGDLEACARFYLRAERSDLAARAWADAGQFAKAGRCHEERDQFGLAGELYEQAGLWKEAAGCYERIEFHRQAAKAYVKCRAWEQAGRCLEAVVIEEFSRVASDPGKRKERRKLVLQSAKLYKEAGKLGRAQDILEKGECYAHAGKIAMERDRLEEAAELFLRGDDPERAAVALRQLGREADASRLLGEWHRDRGNDEEAARLLMAAGEHDQAGDLYRNLGEFLRAGECFEVAGDQGSAAEMYRAAGDLTRAAVAYEGSGDHAEAARCWEELGDPPRRAGALEEAGHHLEAGRIYRELGRNDDAVRVLQKIDPQHDDFRASSAMLGAFFHDKKMFAVAIKKLRQACEGHDVTRDNAPLFYQLARVHEDNGDVQDAVDLYERIMAFDITYEDVDRRLDTVRQRLRIEGSREDETPRRRKSDQRYKIVGELGRGGMGIVYKALDTVLDREVAYKVLPEALKQNAKALENFLREAKSAAQLNHPNIVTVYDAGEQSGQYYIAMELVDGTTLKEIVKRKGVIKPRGVLHVLAQMCEALEFAHAKGIVHRDIKSANTMWTRDKKAKIMDFGLAKAIEEVRNHTTMVSGTPFYMSPEQTLGKNIDHRTDIYSLGVSIFEMATGRVPFREGNVPYHHVHTPPPDPCEVNPKLPPLLGRIISRCLKKDPADRYQTSGEILAEVKAALTRRAEGAARS